jgi:hypothetical protein
VSKRIAGLCITCLALLAAAAAQSAEFEVPKPGPEYAILKSMEGTWDATVKMMMPGVPGKESKSTATWKMECNGLWLVGNFKGEFAGAPFQGRSLESYDAKKKKYMSVWVDSMGTLPMLSEGTYDKEKQTLTATSEYPGMDGKMMKWKMVTEFKDADTMNFTMSTPGKDGKDSVMMTIAYKRKK